MINTTDLNEVEVLLPGDWQREDNGDIYSFTTDKMELRDEQLLRQLIISHAVAVTAEPPGVNPIETTKWSLMIKDDYCGIVIGGQEFIIREIGGRQDGVARMIWEGLKGEALIRFTRV